MSCKNIINDLRVYFDSKHEFKNHVDQLNNKLLLKLGLIKRMCKYFNDVPILYYSLALSKFEYASLVVHTYSILQN